MGQYICESVPVPGWAKVSGSEGASELVKFRTVDRGKADRGKDDSGTAFEHFGGALELHKRAVRVEQQLATTKAQKLRDGRANAERGRSKLPSASPATLPIKRASSSTLHALLPSPKPKQIELASERRRDAELIPLCL